MPIAFPPVLFEVQADGRRYDEMHVDGFVWANVFLNAGILEPAALYRQGRPQPGREDIYVIHNGQLSAPPGSTTRSLRAIAVRSIDISGRAGIVGDLFREYAFARRNGARFQVKHITVKPGQRLSLQKHAHRAEHWVVVSGTARVTRNAEVITLTENQSTYIPLGAVHRLENIGEAPLHLIEVQSGGYLGEDDIVRLEDTYGRS